MSKDKLEQSSSFRERFLKFKDNSAKKTINIINNCFYKNHQLVFVAQDFEQPQIKINIENLSQTLMQLRHEKISNKNILKSAFEWLGIQENHPLLKAGIALSEKADAMLAHSYHNSDHLRDVCILTINMLAVKIMSENNNLDKQVSSYLSQKEKELMGVVLIAAVSHDLNHDGLGNTRMSESGKKYIPFYLEKIASHVARQELEKNNVHQDLISALEAMLYTTDVNEGYKILKNPHHAHSLNLNKELLDQIKNPSVIEMACILRDADLLGSSGLTPEYFDEQTKRLEQEIKGKIDAKGASGFLEHLVQEFYSKPGQVFNDNLNYLINLNHLRLNRSDVKNKSLSETQQFFASDYLKPKI